jgi:hypothetical protein
MAGLVHAVYVAEGRSKQVAGAFYVVQSSRDLQRVLGCGVKFRCCARPIAVLFPARDSSLDLDNQIALPKPFDQFHGNIGNSPSMAMHCRRTCDR